MKKKGKENKQKKAYDKTKFVWLYYISLHIVLPKAYKKLLWHNLQFATFSLLLLLLRLKQGNDIRFPAIRHKQLTHVEEYNCLSDKIHTNTHTRNSLQRLKNLTNKRHIDKCNKSHFYQSLAVSCCITTIFIILLVSLHKYLLPKYFCM